MTSTDAARETGTAPAPGRGEQSEQPDLAERVRADGTTFVLAMFVDLKGRPCAKLIPAKAVERFQQRGTGFAGPAAGLLALGNGAPDLVAIPDPSSYTPLPSVRPGLALVHCDPHVGGRPWPYAPRVILREAVRRAAERGLAPQVGAEVEYYLLRKDERGALLPADPLDDADRSAAYDPQAATRMYDHLTTVSAAMDELGWGNYSNEHEEGNGQYEQNFEHADPLTTADRIITLRYLVEALAGRAGMIATFMPKPFAERIGNGLHLHLSLWRDGRPTFPDPADPRGLGLSPLAYAFVGGIIEHAQALQAVIAPTVNSYKRNSSLTTTAGVAWAPRTATYGGNDRGLYLRVPDGDRVELRGTDGSANPYLALTAALAAGLDGVSRGLDPGDPDVLGPGTGQPVSNGDQPPARRPVLPPTLLHAVEALAADKEVRAALDAAGAPVSAYFADAKRAEFFVWHGVVSSWETERYLTGF